MTNYTPYQLPDIGLGIDTYSPPEKVADGFMSDIENVDPLSNNTLETRLGYQHYYGGVPLRVNTVSKAGTAITLEFDSSQTISFANAGSGPVLVAGTLPTSSGVTDTGDFKTTFSSMWYSSYELSFRQTFAAGTNVTFKKTTSQTGISGRHCAEWPQ